MKWKTKRQVKPAFRILTLGPPEGSTKLIRSGPLKKTTKFNDLIITNQRSTFELQLSLFEFNFVLRNTNMSKLKASYYLNPDVVFLAKDLIGKTLCTRINNKLTCGIITETEA